MELNSRCPFCGGSNCIDRVTMNNDAIYLQCEKGFKCKIYNSVWSGNDGREIKKRYHQMYLLMKKSPCIIKDGKDYDYHFFYDEKLLGVA